MDTPEQVAAARRARTAFGGVLLATGVLVIAGAAVAFAARLEASARISLPFIQILAAGTLLALVAAMAARAAPDTLTPSVRAGLVTPAVGISLVLPLAVLLVLLYLDDSRAAEEDLGGAVIATGLAIIVGAWRVHRIARAYAANPAARTRRFDFGWLMLGSAAPYAVFLVTQPPTIVWAPIVFIIAFLIALVQWLFVLLPLDLWLQFRARRDAALAVSLPRAVTQAFHGRGGDRRGSV
jgi:hypothetical protein